MSQPRSFQKSKFNGRDNAKQDGRTVDELRRLPFDVPRLAGQGPAGQKSDSQESGDQERGGRSLAAPAEQEVSIANADQCHQCESVVKVCPYSVQRRKIKEPLVPPKPNELDKATSIGALRATFGT